MDPCQGGSSSSSRRATTTGFAGRHDNKHKDVMREQQPTIGAEAAAAASSSYYCLFPEEPGRNNDGLQRLHELFSVDRHQHEANPEVFATLQPQFPIHASRQLPTYSFLPQGIHSSTSRTMGVQDRSMEQSIGNDENPEIQFSGSLGNAEQDREEASPLSEDARKIYEHLIAVQMAYLHAYNDPDMITPERHQQTIQGLNNQCARHALAAHSRDNPADADTTVIQQQIAPSGGSGRRNNTTSSRQQLVAPVANTALRLMDLKGQVADSCATRSGSCSIQQAIDVATRQEIIMVCEEMLPCVRMLAIHVFGNHVVQKILEHGPQPWKRKLISRLIGHVFPLSLHVHGCRVIQKALEVGAQDQKVAIAKELSSQALKCVRDKFANHVIQTCLDCVPAQHLQPIFRSFCGRARSLSTDPHCSHVIQKVLDRCNNPEIYDTVAAEIIEFANKLSADKFGNYVVQHLLEHGGGARRSAMVSKFAGRVVSMSYHKFASNVIDKCLTLGSREDRRRITDEIVGAAGGQHLERLLDMMINPSANLVIQRMILKAEEQQVALLVSVARSNVDYLQRYPHGRHVIAAIERFLTAKAGRPVVLLPPSLLPLTPPV
ncbi:hypothetical protein BS78_09G120000 [Paspalum vaginatum]|nr:hypothetical protein BS78_09G120000 [Paspalum vaginatum]